jgi:RNA polymerase sigma-70 factor (ECF subfamily)
MTLAVRQRGVSSAPEGGEDGFVGLDGHHGLEGLIRRHQAGVWRCLRALGADATLAEDLMQEVFIACHRQQPEFGGDEHAGRWLRAVARNLYVSHVRRTVADRRAMAAVEREILARAEAFEQAAPDGGDDYLDALDGCLEQLAPAARTMIEMRHRDGASAKDIAAALGMTPGAVTVALHRVHGRLRACVEAKLGLGGSDAEGSDGLDVEALAAAERAEDQA